MRDPVLLLIALIVLPGCLSAQPGNTSLFNTADSTVVTGKIDGYSAKQEEQFVSYYVYDITGRQQKFATPIQTNGKFSFRFLQQYEGDFGLKYGANFIKAYAQPGEQIEIEIDNNVADKVYHFPGAFKIEGKSASISRHILQFLAIYLPGMYERGIDFKLPVDAFVDMQHNNLQYDLGILTTYNNKNNPPEKFRNWAKNWLTYEAGNRILIKPFLGKDRGNISDTRMIQYLKEIQVDNEKALDNASYYEFLSRFVSNLQMINDMKTGYRSDKERLESVDAITQTLTNVDQYLSGINREIAYYNCYSFNAHSESATYKLEKIWDKLDNVIMNNFLQQALEAKRSSSLNVFTPYNIIDRINNMTVDPTLKKSLVEILEKEKGKYVYIDFWGSWCAPCMAEMPYYKAFIEELKDEPVSFLFLAVETSLRDLQKTREKFDIPGTFLLLNKNDVAIANEVFGFSGYPSHFLLDPKGNLLTKKLVIGVNNKEAAATRVKWFIR